MRRKIAWERNDCSMKKITIHRKWQFANAWMADWVVFDISRSDFMEKYHLPDARSCRIDAHGFPVRRMEFDPGEYGIPIANGKTLAVEADDTVASVFAVTIDGLLSNELILPAQRAAHTVRLITKGGWREPSYPELILLE